MRAFVEIIVLGYLAIGILIPYITTMNNNSDIKISTVSRSSAEEQGESPSRGKHPRSKQKTELSSTQKIEDEQELPENQLFANANDNSDDSNNNKDDFIDNDRLVNGRVTKDSVCLARSVLTFISLFLKVDIDLGGGTIIKSGTDFRTTASEEDMNILKLATTKYVETYKNSHLRDASGEAWAESVMNTLMNGDLNERATSDLTGKCMLVGASLFHNINIHQYVHNTQTILSVHDPSKAKETLILTKWEMKDYTHIDLQWTPEFVVLHMVLWEKNKCVFQVSRKNKAFLKSQLESRREVVKVGMDDHFAGAFAIVPLHICLLDDALDLIGGQILPKFLEVLQMPDFQSNTMSKKILDSLQIASVGEHFDYRDLIETSEAEEDAEAEEDESSTTSQQGTGDGHQLNDLQQSGNYLRANTMSTGERRKKYTKLLHRMGEDYAPKYAPLIKFMRRWLKVHANVSNDVQSTVIYGGMVATQSIWCRWKQEDNDEKPDGALLCWGHGEQFEFTHNLVLANAEFGNRRASLFYEGLTLGLLEQSSRNPIRLIASSGLALNRINGGVPGFLRVRGFEDYLIDWLLANVEERGDEIVLFTPSIPDHVENYLQYHQEELLMYVNGHTPASNASKLWGEIGNGEITISAVTVAMVQSFMAHRGGSKSIGETQLRARACVAETSLERIDNSPRQAYDKIVEILSVDSYGKTQNGLTTRLNVLFKYLNHVSKEKYAKLYEVHNGDVEKRNAAFKESLGAGTKKKNFDESLDEVANMGLDCTFEDV